MRPPSSPAASSASARLAARAAQVGVHVVRLAARVANARDHLLAPRVAAPGSDDVRACATERHGDLPADVARGTRDEGCLVLKSSCHGSDARNVFLDWQVQFYFGVLYAAQVMSISASSVASRCRVLPVERSTWTPPWMPAMKAAGDPVGVQLRADEARGLHLGNALDEVRLPLP